MKILIIGGTSSLGVALKQFLSATDEVTTAGRHNSDITLDLNNLDMNFPSDIDVVILTAAHFGGKTTKEIIDAEYINVSGTLNICEASVKAGVKHLILISTIFVLADKNSGYYSAYSMSKKHGEEAAEFLCNSFSLPLTILRPSQIYGDIHNFNLRQPFLNNILENAQSGAAVNIFGAYDAKFNVIHIDDLVNIISLTAKLKVLGVFSCMNVDDISYIQFANTAFRAFNRPPQIYFIPDKENIKDNIFPKETVLYDKIKYFPQISLEQGLTAIADKRKAEA